MNFDVIPDPDHDQNHMAVASDDTHHEQAPQKLEHPWLVISGLLLVMVLVYRWILIETYVRKPAVVKKTTAT